MDNEMYIKEESILVCPLPLMSKGESEMVVAIKSKGGDCWHYDACIVLDSNPLAAEHITYN